MSQSQLGLVFSVFKPPWGKMPWGGFSLCAQLFCDMHIRIRVMRHEISIEEAREPGLQDYALVGTLCREWPQSDRRILRAFRDANLGRERRLIELLTEQGIEGLLTEHNGLVRDWHEQLREYMSSRSITNSP